jgi:hypothetical protein
MLGQTIVNKGTGTNRREESRTIWLRALDANELIDVLRDWTGIRIETNHFHRQTLRILEIIGICRRGELGETRKCEAVVVIDSNVLCAETRGRSRVNQGIEWCVQVINQPLHPLESLSLLVIVTPRIRAEVFFLAMLFSLVAGEITLVSDTGNAAVFLASVQFLLLNSGFHFSW